MTLEELRILVAACETGSLSALARNLNRTQSAVSQHIARLEAEVGVKLLERQARGVLPTAAGRVLRQFALEGLDAIQMGLQRARDLQQASPSALTITTGGTTVRHFMSGAVIQFRRSHPATTLRFLPAASTTRCFEVLRLSQADLGFVTMGEAPRGMKEQGVARQQMFLLVAASSPLGRHKQLRMRDLGDIRYLGLAGGTSHHDFIERAATERGITLRPEVVFDDFDTARIFVELDLGEAIVPAVQAHNFVRSGAVKAIPIRDLPAVAIGWAFRARDELPSVARGYMELVTRELRALKRVRGLTVL
jgi:DNA-binding transcriptional LysR family regulator